MSQNVSQRDRISQAQYTSCDGMKCSTHEKHCVCVHTLLNVESLIRMTGSPCPTKANWRHHGFNTPVVLLLLFLCLLFFDLSFFTPFFLPFSYFLNHYFRSLSIPSSSHSISYHLISFLSVCPFSLMNCMFCLCKITFSTQCFLPQRKYI